MARARGCSRCSISLVSGSDVGAEARLVRCPAVRASETLHDRCPDCSTRLTRLVLEWEGVAPTRIEECGYCGVVIIDAHEYPGLTAIVTATRALSDATIERLVEIARDSVPPDPPPR